MKPFYVVKYETIALYTESIRLISFIDSREKFEKVFPELDFDSFVETGYDSIEDCEYDYVESFEEYKIGYNRLSERKLERIKEIFDYAEQGWNVS